MTGLMSSSTWASLFLLPLFDSPPPQLSSRIVVGVARFGSTRHYYYVLVHRQAANQPETFIRIKAKHNMTYVPIRSEPMWISIVLAEAAAVGMSIQRNNWVHKVLIIKYVLRTFNVAVHVQRALVETNSPLIQRKRVETIIITTR